MAGKKYTDAQREEFFRLLDKGGTVRAAARAAGVHEDAGYNWLRKTGLTMQRATPRQYSPELKAEFLRLVRERQIISTVARELDIHKPTAYAWARKAGISTSAARRVNPRREEFLRLRAAGLTRAEARVRVGADARSVTDWDKGITIIKRGRIYPDGRIVRYPERDNGGMPERRSRAIGGSVDLNVVERIIDPRYLSVIEREQLQDLRGTGLSIRQIALEMGDHHQRLVVNCAATQSRPGAICPILRTGFRSNDEPGGGSRSCFPMMLFSPTCKRGWR